MLELEVGDDKTIWEVDYTDAQKLLWTPLPTLPQFWEPTYSFYYSVILYYMLSHTTTNMQDQASFVYVKVTTSLHNHKCVHNIAKDGNPNTSHTTTNVQAHIQIEHTKVITDCKMVSLL